MADALTLMAPYLAIVSLLIGLVTTRRVVDEKAPGAAQAACLAALVFAGLGALGLALGGEASGLLRLDPLAAVMLLLISFVGTIVVRYSGQYLGGDARRGRFLSGLCLILTTVSLVVTAGDLTILAVAWVGMSLSLHQLLLYRSERPRAVVAARKKFLLARVGDTALVLAFIMLAAAFGTTSIDSVLAQAQEIRLGDMALTGAMRTWIGLAATFLALAAMLKSAQFPTHGWLTEVMETPTPVSALLHAGVVNAGGFLMIRFADVMMLSMPSLHIVALIGGFTALFGGYAMMTQTSVKVALAYSTVAQMGFMMLQCGLGAFSAAAVHLVAHSLYKAYAFLSSGRAVTIVAKRPAMMPVSPPVAVFGVLSAAGIYVLVTLVFGTMLIKSPAIIALGIVFIAGLSIYLSDIFAKKRTVAIGIGIAAGASASYFLVQAAAQAVLGSSAPLVEEPSVVGWLIMALATLTFLFVAFDQATEGQMTASIRHKAYVHLSRGLYANAVFNKIIGALRIGSSTH